MNRNTSSENQNEKDILKASLEIPFADIKHARIALKTLEVDKEPRRELISKRLSLLEHEGKSTIRVDWTAREARILRVSVNSFLDHLHLVIDTIDQFEDDTTLEN